MPSPRNSSATASAATGAEAPSRLTRATMLLFDLIEEHERSLGLPDFLDAEYTIRVNGEAEQSRRDSLQTEKAGHLS